MSDTAPAAVLSGGHFNHTPGTAMINDIHDYHGRNARLQGPGSSVTTMARAGKPPMRRPHSLALALTLTLIVKCALLYGLWYAFFSHPQTKKMRLPAGQVEQHLLVSQPGPKSSRL